MESYRTLEANEAYEDYEYADRSRAAHRQRASSGRKQKAQPSRKALLAEVTDFNDNITEFVPSYAAALDPHHHERQWVINSVAPFYQDNIITDVTRLVKGGKEANVYCCTGHEASGMALIAAKLYRPRMLRHLKNDAVYKAGRQLRAEDGKQLKGRRELLALRQKSRFGKRVDIMWWIGNEFAAQRTLFQGGADVPKPIAHVGTTILMGYVGDAALPAPPLSEVNLPPDEAQPLFNRVIENVALMMKHYLIHGDLSAYNILYWQGAISIIDFPQMVDARTNPYAFDLLLRDIQRITDYFSRLGVAADPEALALKLWPFDLGEPARKWEGVTYGG